MPTHERTIVDILDERHNEWLWRYMSTTYSKIKDLTGNNVGLNHSTGSFLIDSIPSNKIYSSGKEWIKTVKKIYDQKLIKLDEFLSLCELKGNRWDDKVGKEIDDTGDEDIQSIYDAIVNYDDGTYPRSALELEDYKKRWKYRFTEAFKGVLDFYILAENTRLKNARILIRLSFDDASAGGWNTLILPKYFKD